MTVLIAGAGIAGLTLGLTCQQIGVPFRIFEAVRQLRPLGVGINLQPNAVRELFDLGLAGAMPSIGVETEEYGMFSKHGLEIWTEKRGRHAGYAWPQYSVHRGALQMLLYDTLVARAGAGCVETAWRAEGFATGEDRATLHLRHHDGSTRVEEGALVIAADGINSAIRAQMYPDEGPPIWGGAILWRATSQARPFRTGASMALVGHATQRVVAYPISRADPKTGLATINWLTELTVDPSEPWRKEDWNRTADIADFLPQFEDWVFDWLDVPALVRAADQVLEYPMVDRDPLPRWTEGRVTLMGDAAHATYPVGSNGASQAIVDARKLGAAVLAHGLGPEALAAYEAELRPLTEGIILANRGSGPDSVLQMVEDRCGGRFDDIETVMPYAERAAIADGYKALAGFSIAELNARPPIIAEDARRSG
ncbi:MAG: flavin-dependent oxidoreductase [Pseudomonadota bacterium]